VVEARKRVTVLTNVNTDDKYGSASRQLKFEWIKCSLLIIIIIIVLLILYKTCIKIYEYSCQFCHINNYVYTSNMGLKTHYNNL
jgi:hypothetical protein